MVSDSIASVKKDFPPLLWQNIPELSESEISFPTPQSAPSTGLFDEGSKTTCSHHADVEGSRLATFANWKAVFRRLPVLFLLLLALIFPNILAAHLMQPYQLLFCTH